eukprot:4143039-Pleurochrysis_carterae.AAC.1
MWGSGWRGNGETRGGGRTSVLKAALSRLFCKRELRRGKAIALLEVVSKMRVALLRDCVVVLPRQPGGRGGAGCKVDVSARQRRGQGNETIETVFCCFGRKRPRALAVCQWMAREA